MTAPVRVLLVDDHPVFREGLRSSLQRHPDLEVVGELGDGSDVLGAIEQSRPDVVAMDLRMPNVGGLDATRSIAARFPDVAVVVLTMFDDDASVLAALRAGARGYVLKDADRDDIVRAMLIAARGGSVLGPAASRVVAARLLDGGAAAGRALPELTDREFEVLELLATGLSNSQIADRLRVRPKTVRNHLSGVFSKLHVSDRGQAIVAARDAGVGARPSSGSAEGPVGGTYR